MSAKVLPITTNETLYRDLMHSLNLRGVPIGERPTWGSVKQAVEAFGVTDRTPFSSMEVGIASTGSGRICITEDEGQGIEVRELSHAEVERAER